MGRRNNGKTDKSKEGNNGEKYSIMEASQCAA
jgi:hypothetical protein